MSDCNSGIRVFVGGGDAIPRIWVRDESEVFSNVSQ